MNASQQALQHFLRLAFLRTRHMQQELLAKPAQSQKRPGESIIQLNKLKILEEIIREQLGHEDTHSTARTSR